MNWIAYSLLMFVGSVALYLCVRKSSLVKVPTHLTNLAMFYAVVTACIVIAHKVRLSSLKGLGKQVWLLLIGTGIFSTLFNLGQFQAIRLAPNVGYVNAINAGSISLVTVMAVVLFKDELSTRKAIGVAGVTAGLLLLLL
jgi:uncharacterized membrane protein